MKFIKYIYLMFPISIFTSCEVMTSVGNNWGGISNTVDYGISYWENHVPIDSATQVRIDAWRSGTGGKVLSAGEVVVGAIGELTHKDVSSLKNHIHNASKNLTRNGTYNSSDLNNWVGALFTAGDELIGEYNDRLQEKQINDRQLYEEEKAKLLEPKYYHSKEEALRVSSFDDENNKIIYKPNTVFIHDLMEYRQARNDKWLSENLPEICGMTLDEYNELSPQQRQDMDIKILAYQKDKGTDNTKTHESTITTEPTKPDYSIIIDNTIISDYDINSYNLKEEQKEALIKIAEYLNDDKNLNIIIFGHTCALGSEKVNKELGLKRATEAKEFLVDLGIDPDRISTDSRGFSDPIADNSNIEGRRKNRRITFNIQ